MRSMGWAYEFKVRPWNELRGWYAALADDHSDMQYMLRIVESVENSAWIHRPAAVIGRPMGDRTGCRGCGGWSGARAR